MNYVIHKTNRSETFAILVRETYVPVVTLSVQGNTKLLK